MKKVLVRIAVAALALTIVPLAIAGSPHFIKNATSFAVSGNTITVSGTEAGLGDIPQVHLVLTATAKCVNPGGNHPQADNKTNVSEEGKFPLQNGHADFTLTATATFQPECSPPMTVQFSNVKVTDTTNGISISL